MPKRELVLILYNIMYLLLAMYLGSATGMLNTALIIVSHSVSQRARSYITQTKHVILFSWVSFVIDKFREVFEWKALDVLNGT